MGVVDKLLRVKLFYIILSCSYLSGYAERIDLSLPCAKLKRVTVMQGYDYVSITSGIPLEQQMKYSKTVYVISSLFDLRGGCLNLPDSCYIKFEGGGSIINSVVCGKLLNKIIDPFFWGAYGDGIHDDTKALQNVINITDRVVDLKGRSYYVDGSLTIPSGVSIIGNGAVLFFSSKEKAFPGIIIQGVNSIEIKGVDVVSKNDRFSGSPFVRKNGSKWSNRYAIAASSIASLSIEDCSFRNVECAIKIDGGVGRNRDISIKHCFIDSTVCSPIYISYTTNVIIDSCLIYASMDASVYDHHLYGSEGNIHHLILNTSFSQGSGVPVHYYSVGDTGSDDIILKDCSFFNTCGSVIVSSGGIGQLTVNNVLVKTDRLYDNGIFRSGGKQSLVVNGALVWAPKQRLLNASGLHTIIRNVTASVGGFSYSVPPAEGYLFFSGNHITLATAPYVVYISEKVSKQTGAITITKNHFSIINNLEYLISVRGETSGRIIFDNNVINCLGKAKYAIYNAGQPAPTLIVKNNHFKGIGAIRHHSVNGCKIEDNLIEK